MERYKVLSLLGDGSYGSVWKAINRQTGEVVAIKRMKRKFFSWEECMSLREVRSLRKLSHPSIVKLREVIRENNELFFVFEHLDQNLYQAMKQRQGKPFTEAQIRSWTYQIVEGLNYLHQNGYFHRDMKPENLLVRGGNIIKIADFGLARELSSQPPYTEYVSTRWYRAPEVLLRQADYSAPVDMFAVGAIMAELFTLKPLFPGSTEIDELCKISAVMGSFTAETWPEGDRLSQEMGFCLQPTEQKPLSELIPQASPAAIDLMTSLCQWDPARRPTAAEALSHPFFRELHNSSELAVPVLRERTNTALDAVPSASAAGPLSEPECECAVAEPSRPLPAPASQTPAAANAGPSSSNLGTDWTPMHSSMQIAPPRAAQIVRQDHTQGQGKASRPIPKPHPGQPPDLWINAKGLMQSQQQPGFAQMQRGGVRQGAWGSPNMLVPQKPSFASYPGSVNDHQRPGLIPAHRKAPANHQHSTFRAKKVFKAHIETRQQPSLMVEGKKQVDGARMGFGAGPDAKLGDFGPLSASLRRSAAVVVANQRSGH